MTNETDRIAGSFRDPSGFVFVRDGTIYRQVNHHYAEDYNRLLESGLHPCLTDAGLLIPHTEVDIEPAQADTAYRIIQPEPVDFISYPYEWCFSQLQDAALVTLRIQRTALEHDMSLKDASAYNIQFIDGRPVLIDTLSFEIYQEGQPWVAYRQFCQHFLAPLALMSYKDVRLGLLSRLYIDGIPLDLTAALLPRRTWLKLGLALHLHLHNRAQQRHADSAPRQQASINHRSLLNIVDNLESTIRSLRWRADETAWAGYYRGDSYDQAGTDHKKAVVARYIEQAKPERAWDLGANTGLFSRISSAKGIHTVAWDVDPGAVELNYREMKRKGETHLLPLVLDLTNPSPAIGWANSERDSFTERGSVDLVLALALIHHLAIANNVPLDAVAHFLSELAEWLVIEFVPKSDPKVQKLLAARQDIFPDYTQPGFEAAFEAYFSIIDTEEIQNSARRLYWMRKKNNHAQHA